MGYSLRQGNDGKGVVGRASDQLVVVPVRQGMDPKSEAYTEAAVLAAVDAGVGVSTVDGQQREADDLHPSSG